MHIQRFLLLTSFCLLTACGSSDSDDIRSNGIRADIDIEAPGDGKTYVDVVLEVGSGGVFATELELEGGDTLTSKTDMVGYTDPRTLTEYKDILGSVSYKTNYDFDDGGVEYTIAFEREVDKDAPNSFVTMPEDINIDTPGAAQTFALSDTIDLTWSPSGISDTVQVWFSTECPLTAGGTRLRVSYNNSTNDDGSFSRSVANLIPDTSDLDLSGDCDVNITMARINYGTIDSGFGKGGSITARQVSRRTVSVDLDG